MGPVEEGAKVAGSFVEAMKTQPLALALAISQILLLALFFMIAHWAGENRSTEFRAIMAANAEVQKLLFQCVPASLLPK